ncbi:MULTISPECIES: DUF3053 domain-containing protein [Pantoea]|uniref:Uncharacterized DUF3053 family protein n=2 Tax=Pantoea stewartii TaxID=66269 RepID=H3RIQ9_PANSE|nr:MULTISPECIES: DUF3053 domain-containing protein [Pantoea]KKW49680.1 hypothetical protein XB02_16535 [Pantoea ananatis]ARF51764.1 hypothetical protein DSJ_22380 [Pantoea stewartii subsp. stewartii DC283]EHT98767.1 uncharacterized DUF3053 family protein [Pantoea stewartii subsp. stewartii DC283]KAB0558149.1 DUF3053 domain-containing protein [Pantoea stewartii subsp. stewartii]KTS28859.1 hypothetical protein NS381_06645 [Pantoea stewartii]
MASGISRVLARSGIMLAGVLIVLQLTACGDKEGEQRKAFIDFMQNTVMRSGEHLPSLSENQKQSFGPFAGDYAILYGFSQQVNKTVDQGMRPVVDELSAIRVPQDYLSRRDSLAQATSALTVATQQLESAKMQADKSKAGLKQSDDLKKVFDTAYDKVVTQPAAQLIPLLPKLQALSQDAVKTGEFLQAQGTRVSFNNGGVQFPTQEQATQYNSLMTSLSANVQALTQAKNAVQGTGQ